ncbi:5-oxoprolinase subunit PxpB [Limosilactobacillus mucosae]|uniref:5-oxoprolinase subunit PxpB n=1 Tax=Limosilactobacillus mucosae TaxID=97478 RepID=UPI00233EDA0F|nr:5-oxoprolinase subunit PxpB [Limosilactobacillus mucosae]MDC2841338.1 5-oxoprolinase subunit PxpB [Limosilactobacillus mucosae]MDC2846021.1 5-oxoprolinase subunit PxpB [Limosilactobacillus mucosae]
MTSYQIIPVGDQALAIEFANRIDPVVNRHLQQIGRYILKQHLSAVKTIIPAYRTLTVTFDGGQTSFEELKDQLKPLIEQSMSAPLPPSKTWLIPVCYGGKHGPDLDDVARFAGLSAEEVVNEHVSKAYLIYFLGFLPGFAYMGSVDQKIAMPRLEQPRLEIPAGSVGIAGKQTGFYPVASPGGWRIIGQTPLKLYDEKNPASFYHAGDSVKFFAIDEDEFQKIQLADQLGKYQVKAVTSDADD